MCNITHHTFKINMIPPPPSLNSCQDDYKHAIKYESRQLFNSIIYCKNYWFFLEVCYSRILTYKIAIIAEIQQVQFLYFFFDVIVIIPNIHKHLKKFIKFPFLLLYSPGKIYLIILTFKNLCTNFRKYCCRIPDYIKVSFNIANKYFFFVVVVK